MPVRYRNLLSVKETVTFSLIRIVTICETQNSDQILTRIWPLLTRLTDDSLLLLHTDKVYTNLASLEPHKLFQSVLLPSSWASFCLSHGIISRLSFSVFSDVDVITISSSSEKKYENQFCINHLYTRKLDVFSSFVHIFLSRWFFDIFEFNPDQIRRAAQEQTECSIVTRNTSPVNQWDIHRHTVKKC